MPRCRRCCSRAVATVDLPDAERPVSQRVMPRWPRSSARSARERDGCQVMLLGVSLPRQTLYIFVMVRMSLAIAGWEGRGSTFQLT